MQAEHRALTADQLTDLTTEVAEIRRKLVLVLEHLKAHPELKGSGKHASQRLRSLCPHHGAIPYERPLASAVPGVVPRPVAETVSQALDSVAGMPDEFGNYTRAERNAYQSPACPQCGGRTITTWIPSGGMSDPPDMWFPTTHRCADPKCVSDG